jgi:hypothetical protein
VENAVSDEKERVPERRECERGLAEKGKVWFMGKLGRVAKA